MSFYDDMAGVASALLAPDETGGLGASSGSVTLTRRTITPASDPWGDPTVAENTETLRAQVFGVSSEYIGLPAAEPGNGVVLASDLMCIMAVPTGGLQPGDVVSVNDVPVAILRVERIPAAGTVSAYRVIVRGGAV